MIRLHTPGIPRRNFPFSSEKIRLTGRKGRQIIAGHVSAGLGGRQPKSHRGGRAGLPIDTDRPISQKGLFDWDGDSEGRTNEERRAPDRGSDPEPAAGGSGGGGRQVVTEVSLTFLAYW